MMRLFLRNVLAVLARVVERLARDQWEQRVGPDWPLRNEVADVQNYETDTEN